MIMSSLRIFVFLVANVCHQLKTLRAQRKCLFGTLRFYLFVGVRRHQKI